MHVECGTKMIQEIDEVKKNVEIAGNLLQVFISKASRLNAELYIPRASERLLQIKEEFKILIERVNQAWKENNSVKGEILNSQLKDGFRFHIKLKKDEVLGNINHLSNLNEAEDIEKNCSFIEQERVRLHEANKKVLEKYKSKVESDTQKANKEQQKRNEEFKKNYREECKEQIEAIFREQIQLLEQNLASKDQLLARGQQCKEDLEQMAEELTRKVESQGEELEEQIALRREAEDAHEEMKKDLAELNLDKNLKAGKAILKDLGYENEIIMDLNSEEGKDKRDILSQIKLPDLNMLKIDYITKTDSVLKKFFSYSCPPTIRLFCFNHKYIEHFEDSDSEGSNNEGSNNEGSESEDCENEDSRDNIIDIGYYLSSMKKVLKRTTKEIYIERLIVSPESLSKIVKASSQCERLTIRYSKIITSDSLDFTTSAPYKTNYLSFCNCGINNWNYMEWDKYPERFGEILEAIEASSLKDSLQTINIRGCDISESQANDLLKENGLSSINVIIEVNDPLES